MAIAKVQFVGVGSVGNVTTLAATIASTGAGNTLIACIATGGAITPTTPGGWTLLAGPVACESTPSAELFFYGITGISAGLTSVTFNFASCGAVLGVWEFSGATITIDKQTSTANQVAAAIVTGTTAATLNAADLIVAAVLTHQTTAPTWSAQTAGYTNETKVDTTGVPTHSPNMEPAFKIVAATGTQAYGATASSFNGGAGIIIALKASVGGTISSGVVDMGSNASLGLAPVITTALTGVVNTGDNLGGLATVLTVALSTVVNVGDTLGGLAPVVAITRASALNLGSAGGGLQDTTVRVNLSFTLGSAGGGLIDLAVYSGIVDMGNTAGGLTALSIAQASLADVGMSGGGVAPVLSLALATVMDLGNTGTGLLATSFAVTGAFNLGDAGGGLTSIGAVNVAGIAKVGSLGGGIFIPPPISSGLFHVGSMGSGMVTTGSIIIRGEVTMGGYTNLWLFSQGGIAPTWGRVGEPLGQWIAVIVWIWRSGSWVNIPVKRWKTGTWHLL